MVKELSNTALDILNNKKGIKEAINDAANLANVNPLVKTGEIIEDMSGINVLDDLETQSSHIKHKLYRLKKIKETEITDIKNNIKKLGKAVLDELPKNLKP